ncbi:MAG: tRNA (N6-isopentenyl adenosine(37)-C2)-methylthiotransferase MiaB [Bacteroidetes bacterium HGW-Bacteroidetes-21]|jgi:tRNA-2-methylthio-N6-dimethylallyladenosine synthase|nr:MAG: tRNA (N6-isopentenyl adenosine(37)-C2)-methylthiotransferase MiaB [Bacteroidetes bacterium HGW-Bacteroidetes-21]
MTFFFHPVKSLFLQKKNLKVYIETYGCQMNVADSELIASLLKEKGYSLSEGYEDADLILVNTCSIRENAEQRVRGRLKLFGSLKRKNPDLVVGVVGCMAQRLKDQLILEEKSVSLVVGPDQYRQLPELIESARNGQAVVQAILSSSETYDDIVPVRYDGNGISAFVSIMRGCQNMCSYCIVPYVRGGERSRDPESILSEIQTLKDENYKEVTLIGQNVDSYIFHGQETLNFHALLEKVALRFPDMWIRFSTNHPKDLNDHLLEVMSRFPNICKSIHLPVQSGSTTVLERMKRGYTRDWYLDRIQAIRRILPECTISTDVMVGFSGETDEEHLDTLSLMEAVSYDFAFMFKYSERSGTWASRHMKDDVPEKSKVERLNQVIALQGKVSERVKKEDIGKVFDVLVEGVSKRSTQQYFGRTSGNKVVVFPKGNVNKGDFTRVLITSCTSATLIGEIYEQ